MTVVPVTVQPALFRYRLVRFMAAGASCAVLQLALLAAFEAVRVQPLLADGLAFAVAAQCNFVLSGRFTWRDRVEPRAGSHRWLLFLASMSASAVLNLAVFHAARSFAPDPIAAALGIVVGASSNYVLGDRAVFAHGPSAHPADRGDYRR